MIIACANVELIGGGGGSGSSLHSSEDANRFSSITYCLIKLVN